MKKVIALLLSLAMIAALAACGNAGTETATTGAAEKATEAGVAAETTVAGLVEGGDVTVALEEEDVFFPEELKDKLVIGVSQDGKTFDPSARGGFGSVDLQMFQKLLATDAEGNDKLIMLKSYEKVDDLTYNFELWDCITDTAGNKFTAEDAVYCIQLFVDNGNAGGVNCLNVKEDGTVDIDITGEYTFTWHCGQAFGLGDFSKNLGNPTMFTKKAYEDSGDDHFASSPVATGPYKLKEYVAGSKVIMEANEDYWMKKIEDKDWLKENFYILDAQNVKEIEYDIIQDSATRAMALEKGDVDVIDTANAADIEMYLNDPSFGIKAVRKQVDPPVAFYFNCNEVSATADVNLRMAICYAIDNQAIADGNSYPCFPVYGMQPNMFDAPKEWKDGREYYDYNVEKAKEYLAKTSYAGEPLVAIYQSGQGAYDDAVVVMQSQLREVGINLELLPLDNNTLSQYKVDYPSWNIAFETMGGGSYLSATLKKFWTEDSAKTCNGNQVTGIIDTKLDELYVALRADNSDANIKAWDDYFTFEKCYGYALVRYFEQTACREGMTAAATSARGGQLVGGAFTFDE